MDSIIHHDMFYEYHAQYPSCATTSVQQERCRENHTPSSRFEWNDSSPRLYVALIEFDNARNASNSGS